jgi:hypothetical protein
MTVTELLKRHAIAWIDFSVIEDTPDSVTNNMTAATSDLYEAKPATIREFLAKWRHLARFEAELGDPTDYLHKIHVINEMIKEMERLSDNIEIEQHTKMREAAE